jgi:prepilin-type N-terminal cleavage/methylation domain-containing protein
MKAFRPGRASRQGFTLIEVIVAMTIVGLGVVTLFEIFSLGMRLGARSSVRTEAISYGRQVMDEFMSRRTWHDGTEQSKLNANTRWTLHVQSLPRSSVEAPLATAWELKSAALEVIVGDAGRERYVELTTVRLFKKEAP